MAFTFFFRDCQALDLIVQYVLPDLLGNRYVNIWDAGCAHGPEPYSIAITCRENMGHFCFRNVRICATDIDESGQFGETIVRGVYPDAEVKRIPAQLLERYFAPVAESGHFRISEEIRNAVRFQRHDLLSLQPVRDGFGLIVCKNVLLHFSQAQRIEVLRMFHRALAERGYLVMEQTQKLPFETESLFRRVTEAAQLFQKV
jgi:chemotaxis protein methyltransferase CheR